jgi:hypothetical protein
MDPDPSKLLRPPSRIDLLIKELGNCDIIKGDRHGRARLPHQDEVFNQEQVCGVRDPESANFRVSVIS